MPDTGRPPDSGARPGIVQQLDFEPGGLTPRRVSVNPYANDAAALGEGRRMYGWFNCGGCHFEGGGGIGPALMDEAWVYGGEPQQIFDSIASGRANGMPAFGNKLTVEQMWKIALYVESLAANAPDAPRASRRTAE